MHYTRVKTALAGQNFKVLYPSLVKAEELEPANTKA